MDVSDLAKYYGNTGCGVVNWGYKIKKIFAEKSTYLFNFENWVNGEVSNWASF